jgi:hypothetical protein
MAAFVLSVTGCVKSGEIAVTNASGSTMRVVAYSGSCEPGSVAARRAWETVLPGGETKLLVASGSFVGDACLGVSHLGRLLTLSVSPGRTYEVTSPGDRLVVTDVGGHDEPWYFEMQRWELSWSSWWIWFYVVPLALGAPVGLFITVRFFHRYYVLRQG